MTGRYNYREEIDRSVPSLRRLCTIEPATLKSAEYVHRLEQEYASMQQAMLTLTTKYARLQFHVRQILQAAPCERYQLLKQLEYMDVEGSEQHASPPSTSSGMASNTTTPIAFGRDEERQIERDLEAGDIIKRQQNGILKRLRRQLEALVAAPPHPI